MKLLKVGVIGSFIALMVPNEAYAMERICNISIQKTDFNNAALLNGGGYYIMENSYLPDLNGKLNMPREEYVEEGIISVLSAFEKAGINTNNFAKEGLFYEIVNAEMPGVLGHAFVLHHRPTVYLYGNQTSLSQQQVRVTTVHEFGHYIETYFTYEDKEKYRQIRGIPFEWLNNASGSKWEERFQEAFADDFTSLFLENFNSRAAVGPIPPEKKEILKTFMLDTIKKRTGELFVSGQVESYIFEKREKLRINALVCDSYMATFLDEEPSSGKQLLNWYLNELASRDKGFEKYIKMIALERVLADEGFNINSMGVSKSDHKKILDILDILLQYYSKFNKGNEAKIWPKNPELNNSYNFLITSGLLSPKSVNQYDMNKRMTLKEVVDVLYKDLNLRDNNKSFEARLKNLIKLGYMSKTIQRDPNSNVTREQAAFILTNTYDLNGTRPIKFKDNQKIHSRYYNAVSVLYHSGIIKGYPTGEFKPKENVTRHHFITMLNRAKQTDITDNSNPGLNEIVQQWREDHNKLPNKNLSNKDIFTLLSTQKKHF